MLLCVDTFPYKSYFTIDTEVALVQPFCSIIK